MVVEDVLVRVVVDVVTRPYLMIVEEMKIMVRMTDPSNTFLVFTVYQKDKGHKWAYRATVQKWEAFFAGFRPS